MLGKLIKYDLRSMFRTLLPLCGAFIIVGILAGFSFPNVDTEKEPLVLTIIFATVIFALVAMTIAVSVISLIIVITRFYKNFLGGEGYLTFTLPVGMKTQLASKFISGYLSFVIAFLSGLLSYGCFAFIGAVRTGDVVSLGQFFNGIAETIEMIMNDNKAAVLIFILTAIATSIKMIMKIYFSIMLGHQSENHKVLMSFVAFILLSIFESLISHIIGLVFLGVGLASSLLGEMTLGYLTASLVLEIIMVVLFTGGTYYLMTNRLNLE